MKHYFSSGLQKTRLSSILAQEIHELRRPILSNYELFLLVWHIYENKNAKYLRSNVPSHDSFLRVRRVLRKQGVIIPDKDYTQLWRATDNPDKSADEIACAADLYCYISYFSALQRYGLTVRRPKALHLTQPSRSLLRQLLIEQVERDWEFDEDRPPYAESLFATYHPPIVRGQKMLIHSTQNIGNYIQIKGSYARIATIGQTFLDTVSHPERCGGMLHVLDIWKEHSKTYLEDIVLAIDDAPKTIQKVRAGYILSELLGISDSRVNAWKQFAQRGGSRVLDPTAPYAPKFSEDWMMSINVG